MIVGHAGSGKTEALASLLRAVSTADGFALFPAHPSSPPNSQLLAEIAPGADGRATFWQQYWRAVLLVTLYSFLTNRQSISSYDRAVLDAVTILGHEKPRLIPDVGSSPRHVFTVFKQLGALVRGVPDRRDYLDDARWDEIEQRLADLLEHDTPVALVVDEIDDWRDHQPHDYAELQLGLVREVIRLNQTSTLRTRFLVLTSLDVALYDQLTRAHPTKFSDSFLRLQWETPSLARFAEDLVNSSKSSLIMLDPADSEPLTRIAGVAEVPIEVRGARERLWNYALRHGAGTPRAIVALVNELSSLAAAAADAGITAVPLDRLKLAIRNYACASGWELLNECASRLLASVRTADAPVSGGLGEALGTSADRVVVDLLLNWISGYHSELVSVLDFFERDQYPLQMSPHEFLALLWSSRLAGAAWRSDDGRSVHVEFCAAIPSPPFPANAKYIVFHSSLIDLARLQPERCHLTVAFGGGQSDAPS